MKSTDQLSLKNKSIKEFEDALASAMSSLMGKKYMVKINHLNFLADSSARLKDTCEMTISVGKFLDGAFYDLNDTKEKY